MDELSPKYGFSTHHIFRKRGIGNLLSREVTVSTTNFILLQKYGLKYITNFVLASFIEGAVRNKNKWEGLLIVGVFVGLF